MKTLETACEANDSNIKTFIDCSEARPCEVIWTGVSMLQVIKRLQAAEWELFLLEDEAEEYF